MKKPLSIFPWMSGRTAWPSEDCRVHRSSVGCSGGPDLELLSIALAGLAKPLLGDGDNGTALIVPVEGDRETRSDARRSCGVAFAYISRAVGDVGWGKCGEREGGAITGEGELCLRQYEYGVWQSDTAVTRLRKSHTMNLGRV
jgi:hypothetical protein